MTDSAKPIIVLSSGGKDSMMMVERLLADPHWQIRALVTTINERSRRVAMHGTPESLVRAQAGALGLDLTLIELPEDCDNRVYEQRLHAGLEPFLKGGAKHVACGDLFLADIRQWREALFDRLGWVPIFPIWQECTEQLAQVLAGPEWGLLLTCVDTTKLPEDFLGRLFDQALLDELPEGVDPCGENGEFHSFVFNAPAFSSPLEVETGEKVLLHDRYATLDVHPPLF
jgi:uncharacterized protein (TIGR00290 family)